MRPLDQNEVLRYLGIKGQADAATLEGIAACSALLFAHAAFKYTIAEMPLVLCPPQTVMLGPLTIKSEALHAHLLGCKGAYLFAATLGAAVERLMQRVSATDMAQAVLLQACAAALLEALCDEAQQALEKGPVTSRFSPGYGDFSLEHQQALLQMLDAHKQIGLACTAKGMLVPTKSITAVIGIGTRATACAQPCAACPMHECLYRRETS